MSFTVHVVRSCRTAKDSRSIHGCVVRVRARIGYDDAFDIARKIESAAIGAGYPVDVLIKDGETGDVLGVLSW